MCLRLYKLSVGLGTAGTAGCWGGQGGTAWGATEAALRFDPSEVLPVSAKGKIPSLVSWLPSLQC